MALPRSAAAAAARALALARRAAPTRCCLVQPRGPSLLHASLSSSPPSSVASSVASSFHTAAPTRCGGPRVDVASGVISYEQLRGLIQDPAAEPAAAAGYTLIDVRQPEEWAHGTIPSAKLIPLGQVHEAFEMDGEDFEDEYGWLVACGRQLQPCHPALGSQANPCKTRARRRAGVRGCARQR